MLLTNFLTNIIYNNKIFIILQYSYKYKTLIYTFILVIIPKYTYNYESSYTIVEFL